MNYPINSLKINRFRGLDSLDIDNLSRINIFLGKNNAGKTSILEAIFLLTGMSNPTLPNLINAIREGGATAMENLSWLFYDKKIEYSISISDGVSRAIQIEPILGLETGSGSTPTSSNSGASINGLRCLFYHNNKKGAVSFSAERNSITLERSNYKEKIIASFLPSNEIKANLLSNIESIIKKNKKRS